MELPMGLKFIEVHVAFFSFVLPIKNSNMDVHFKMSIDFSLLGK